MPLGAEPAVGGMEILEPMAKTLLNGARDVASADGFYVAGRSVLCMPRLVAIAPPPMAAMAANRTAPATYAWREGANLSVPVFVDGDVAVFATDQGAFAISVTAGEPQELLASEMVCCIPPVAQRVKDADYVWFGVEAPYSVRIDGIKKMSTRGLMELFHEGQLRGDTLLWRAGMKDWMKASETPHLGSLFSGGSVEPAYMLLRCRHKRGGCLEPGAFSQEYMFRIPEELILCGGWIGDDGSPEFLVRQEADFHVMKFHPDADRPPQKILLPVLESNIRNPSLRRQFCLVGKSIYYCEKQGSQASRLCKLSNDSGPFTEFFCRTMDCQNGSHAHEFAASQAKIGGCVGNLVCSVGSSVNDASKLVAWCDNGNFALQNRGTVLNHIEAQRRKLPWPHQTPGPVWRTPYGAVTAFDTADGKLVWLHLC